MGSVRFDLVVVTQVTLVVGLAAWGVLALLERTTRHATAIWTALAVVVLVASYVPVFLVEATTVTRVPCSPSTPPSPSSSRPCAAADHLELPEEPVMRSIFVNLPVADVAVSRSFFTALGFGINEQFSDEHTACVVIEENVFAMVMTPARFADFVEGEIADAHKAIEVLLALSETGARTSTGCVRPSPADPAPTCRPGRLVRGGRRR